MIRIALKRIGADFQQVSDDYLIRPAEQDFWRLESAGNGKAYVSRIVSSAEGEDPTPDVFEVNREVARTAARVRTFSPAPLATPDIEMDSLGVGRDDEFVVLDKTGRPYPLTKSLNSPYSGMMPRRTAEVLRLLVALVERILKSVSDQGWGREYKRLVDFLETKGPVQFGSTDFKTLTDQIYDLSKRLDMKARGTISDKSLSERENG